MKIFLETNRLILREIVLQDIDGMFELDADPDVHKYLGNNPVKNKGEAEKNIDFIRQQYIENNIGRWAVIEKDSNNFIGWAGLKFVKEEINRHINYYDLGYRLIKKYWGKGYATEAAKASLAYGFDQLNLPEIIAIADCDNIGSNKILTKIGLKRIEEFSLKGVKHNWYRLSQKDWHGS
ncbi:GNAT family N-acetyltransferase [Olivibacter sp. SDN3]|uniref:GNAT family N-acetyltransferase n=1 Tax=Olivibacter sp. SDN3 TaxID=2764720 RepID=UPI001651AE52|nr:GNAT family N-acetyltransferase [Olivibacter sp. SDN3]QNL47872.1 GNAT family N-acetyltransferase [Olivibacter sp. SDN3]